MATKANEVVNQAWKSYKKYVTDFPETVSQIEATSRVLSYIIAGRFEDSQVFSELVYLASNLLILVNDTIIKNASKVIPKIPLSVEKLKRLLTVLEYGEVFIEIAAYRKWGESGKWVFIVIIQLTKAIWRLLLLWKHHAGIQPSPPLAQIDREKYTKQFKHNPTEEMQEFQENLDGETEGEPVNGMSEVTFTLKRSGKVVRRLSAAPPVNFRSWKLPSHADREKERLQFYEPTMLSKPRLWGETLYIARPLIHLFSMYVCGTMSWKPWIASGTIDVASLCMMGDSKDMNPQEKTEIKRRSLMLLYYLLRSPFFDDYSKMKMLSSMKVLADNVPGLGILLRPMIDYLPSWQKIYFYLWSA
ncbi:peroxisomal membrane protein PEX16-like isoform X2 [Ostrea edulis]|uniref:peroxisomal membrane protein PEX16-like isoform X2 n=1 Tax=Ostrea edulis TaxID=37623 RepID=UPI0024AFEEF6|nr:peroxisomal membrane protein PEX16-like isoform X2 [Ostrea edulis]